MKIYTRTGDKGTTALLGGKRVSKSDLRIEAYGTVDELNSYLGLLRDHEELSGKSELLIRIQNQLFVMGSHLAAEPGKSFDYIPDFKENESKVLEDAIDEMDASLPEMRNFILPGGHQLVSFIHIARCVCRRAERAIIELSQSENVLDQIIIYLNRLSDYLFVLSRVVAQQVGAEEVPWTPRK